MHRTAYIKKFFSLREIIRKHQEKILNNNKLKQNADKVQLVQANNTRYKTSFRQKVSALKTFCFDTLALAIINNGTEFSRVFFLDFFVHKKGKPNSVLAYNFIGSAIP